VSHSTVARRVEALEERLKVRLFDRTPDGYCLTGAGAQMVARAERVEQEMATLERELLGQDERLKGRVRVTCTDEFLSDLIVQNLAPFCLSYPSIDLEISPSYRPYDLSKREADIALRILRLDKQPPEHLLGRKLVPIYYANYVAREHEQRLDPEIVGSRSRWLGWTNPKTDAMWVLESSYPDVPVWGSFMGMGLQRSALRAGLGIANLPCFVGDADPALRRLGKADLKPWFSLWILSHPDLRDTERLRLARDHLTQAILGQSSRFLGDRPAAEE
jgi:DNA-binding transcriptional LysR family regulator